MPEIFISYRRNDSLGYAGRLADDLRKLFGDEHIFRDYESLGVGVPFKQEILDAIGSSSVVLVLIGSTWLETDPNTGEPRLNNANDFVRLEVEHALQCDITVIPILVGGAKMPKSVMFPKKMQDLANSNAHDFFEKHWDDDALLLAKKLEQITGLDIIKEGMMQSSRTSMIKPLVNIIPDFLNLIIKPKIFLRKRCHGSNKDILGAFTFFNLIILISQFYMYYAWPSPSETFWTSISSGVLLGFLLTLLLSIPMWFAWWLVGARDHYLRTTVVLLYQMSVSIIIATIGASIIVMTAAYSHADEIDQVYQILKNPDISNKSFIINEMLVATLTGTPETIAIIIGLSVISIVPIWLLLSWAAYREILQRPLWAVWLAFPIFISILSLPSLISIML